MTKITLKDFLMGRDKAAPITPIMQADAEDLLEKVNALLIDFYKAYPDAPARTVSSGYRPAAFNAAAGGAKLSNHMICRAIDLTDRDQLMDKFLTLHPEMLIKHDLYREHPDSTPNWAHLSSFPPKSKKRTFLP
mgnify:FL=1